MGNRRQFLLGSALGALLPVFARARLRPVKIGVLSVRARSVYTAPVMKRLADLGYAGMSWEYRHAEGAVERFVPLARELSTMGCDLIMAFGSYQAAHALRQVGTRTPVVFIAVDYDPVQRKLVDSLSRPGSNFTGVFAQSSLIAAKRLELAHELTSSNRFLVLSDTHTEEALSAVKNAAKARGVQVMVSEFSERPYAYAAAFETGRQSDVRGVVVLTSPVFADERAGIAALALKHRLPTVGFALADTFVIGHSADAIKMAHIAAEMAARILKGANPAGMPVQQADQFDLIVNLRTARALGIKVPQSVSARATRIVE